MERSLAGGAIDQARWDAEGLPACAERVARAGTPALLANSLAAAGIPGGGFGGTFSISGAGEVLSALPLGREGMLLVDL